LPRRFSTVFDRALGVRLLIGPARNVAASFRIDLVATVRALVLTHGVLPVKVFARAADRMPCDAWQSHFEDDIFLSTSLVEPDECAARNIRSACGF